MRYNSRSLPLPGLPRAVASRRGDLLVEFAFIAVILYLLLAGIIEFGRALFAAQVIQQAADTAARELSRTPLPPTGTLTGTQGVLATSTAAKQIYNEDLLVVDLGQLAPGQTLRDYFAGKPMVNQMLVPLMIFGTQGGKNLAYYPGQLVADPTRTSGFRVVIPIVTYQNGTDAIIQTIPVVEEITPDPAATSPNYNFSNPNPDFSPFNLLATFGGQVGQPGVLQPGVIALRINYPFQAATLVSYQQGAQGIQTPTTTNEGGSIGPYGGDSGLGKLLALDRTVRPFRRVLSAQAVFRREMFE